MTRWQLHIAKDHFSEVVRKCRAEGPHVITVRGADAVVLVEANEYVRLARNSNGTLLDFLRNSPLLGVELDLDRGVNRRNVNP